MFLFSSMATAMNLENESRNFEKQPSRPIPKYDGISPRTPFIHLCILEGYHASCWSIFERELPAKLPKQRNLLENWAKALKSVRISYYPLSQLQVISRSTRIGLGRTPTKTLRLLSENNNLHLSGQIPSFVIGLDLLWTLKLLLLP